MASVVLLDGIHLGGLTHGFLGNLSVPAGMMPLVRGLQEHAVVLLLAVDSGVVVRVLRVLSIIEGLRGLSEHLVELLLALSETLLPGGRVVTVGHLEKHAVVLLFTIDGRVEVGAGGVLAAINDLLSFFELIVELLLSLS